MKVSLERRKFKLLDLKFRKKDCGNLPTVVVDVRIGL